MHVVRWCPPFDRSCRIVAGPAGWIWLGSTTLGCLPCFSFPLFLSFLWSRGALRDDVLVRSAWRSAGLDGWALCLIASGACVMGLIFFFFFFILPWLVHSDTGLDGIASNFARLCYREGRHGCQAEMCRVDLGWTNSGEEFDGKTNRSVNSSMRMNPFHGHVCCGSRVSCEVIY
ncbi:hypothetical protein LY78DRAFT_144091 [Colletotrichum sublineola]|nr:hypothetical protein LY78DRAFT_144091 [Colletotrichum sublineola]